MNQRGFSLVEVVFSGAILAVIAMALVSGAATSHAASRTLDGNSGIYARGEGYLEALMALPHGTGSDGTATASELSELFDGDEIYGTATLRKLNAFGPAEFTVPGSGLPGRWRIEVSDDLDGDGDTEDDAEGRGDILRITVMYDGRLIARTTRFEATAGVAR